jgi:hypothetical protein
VRWCILDQQWILKYFDNNYKAENVFKRLNAYNRQVNRKRKEKNTGREGDKEQGTLSKEKLQVMKIVLNKKRESICWSRKVKKKDRREK